MKANEFVKKYGIEAAIDLWCGAFDLYNNNLQILNGMVCSFPGNQFLFDLVDIKRIVESHRLIEVEGGIDQVKDTFSFAYKHGADELTEYGKRLKQAIFDVESCQ